MREAKEMPRKPTRRAPASKASKPFPAARGKIISGFPGIGTPHQHPLFQLAALATRKSPVPEKHALASMRVKTPAKQSRGNVISFPAPRATNGTALVRPPAKRTLSKSSKTSPKKR
jgi:hypothetical protein